MSKKKNLILITTMTMAMIMLSACGKNLESTRSGMTLSTESSVADITKIATAILEATVEVTDEIPIAQDAVEKLPLNPERKYTVINNYVVDGFNQAKMAKWNSETNEWVDTTLEEKYGHLALIEPKIPYVDIDAVVEGRESFYQGDKNFKEFRFYPVWTGNTEERVMDFEGREIRDLTVEVVFRDSRNILFRALISYNSPDLKGDGFIQWIDYKNQTSDFYIGPPEDLLEYFVPGQQIEEYFITDRPNYAIPPQGNYCGYENSLCVEEYRKNIYIYNSDPEILKKFAQELQEGIVDESMNGIVLTGTYMGDLIFMFDPKP